MNMLQVQDALKNASDDQLMREMTNPTGMAPQFLVLSEMKRRKDMRAKVEPPQGTVADDLLAQDDGGIRDMVAQENPEAEPVEEMAAGGLASLRHYREGGAIRYSEGGGVDPDDPNITPFESLLARRRRDADERQARIERNLAIERSTSGQQRDAGIFGFFTAPQGRRAESQRVVATSEANRPELVRNPQEFQRFVEDPAAYTPAPGPSVPPRSTTVAPTQNTEQRPDGQRPSGNQGNNQGGSQARVTGQGQAAPAASPAVAQPDGISEGIQRLASSLPDRISGLARRLEEGRTDPATRRSEAMNMALIDAGLRIAGSASPRLAGAIAEGGVPALQAFTQAQQQIRQDQRADDREALQLALAQNQRDFYLGRLSAQELDMRNRREISEAENRTRLQAAGISANAAPASVREMEHLERLRTTNPQAYEAALARLGRDGRSQLSGEYSAAARDMNNLLQRLQAAMSDEERAAIQSEIRSLQPVVASLRSRMLALNAPNLTISDQPRGAVVQGAR